MRKVEPNSREDVEQYARRLVEEAHVGRESLQGEFGGVSLMVSLEDKPDLVIDRWYRDRNQKNFLESVDALHKAMAGKRISSVEGEFKFGVGRMSVMLDDGTRIVVRGELAPITKAGAVDAEG